MDFLVRSEFREYVVKLGGNVLLEPATCIRDDVQMTSAKFSGFWTPSIPLVSTKSTQPPLLWSDIGQPPPSPSEQTSYVHAP